MLVNSITASSITRVLACQHRITKNSQKTRTKEVYGAGCQNGSLCTQELHRVWAPHIINKGMAGAHDPLMPLSTQGGACCRLSVEAVGGHQVEGHVSGT